VKIEKFSLTLVVKVGRYKKEGSPVAGKLLSDAIQNGGIGQKPKSKKAFEKRPRLLAKASAEKRVVETTHAEEDAEVRTLETSLVTSLIQEPEASSTSTSSCETLQTLKAEGILLL